MDRPPGTIQETSQSHVCLPPLIGLGVIWPCDRDHAIWQGHVLLEHAPDRVLDDTFLFVGVNEDADKRLGHAVWLSRSFASTACGEATRLLLICFSPEPPGRGGAGEAPACGALGALDRAA